MIYLLVAMGAVVAGCWWFRSCNQAVIGRFHGYRVCYDNGLYSPAALAYLNSGMVILCGPRMASYPDEECDAILYHELGHAQFGHTNGRTLHNELAADSYAVQHVGRDTYLNMLRRTMTLYGDNPRIVQELTIRIEAVLKI